MNKIALSILFIVFNSSLIHAQESVCVKLSQDMLKEVRDEKDYSKPLFALACINPDSLAKDLSTDNRRKAFWLNMYNAIVQLTLNSKTGQASLHNHGFKSKVWLLVRKNINITQILNGILRRSRSGNGVNFGRNFFPSAFEKQFRLDTADCRILFAINFGAKDCPPIEIYSALTINERLDKLTSMYIKANCSFDDSTKTLSVPQIFGWFYPDFGRRFGINALMIKYGVILEGLRYEELNITPFNTQLERGKYALE